MNFIYNLVNSKNYILITYVVNILSLILIIYISKYKTIYYVKNLLSTEVRLRLSIKQDLDQI